MNFKKGIKSLLLWVALSCLMGLLGGAVGAAFSSAISAVTNLRQSNEWLIFLLPIAGVLTVAVYKALKVGHTGTTAMFRAADGEGEIPIGLSPAVFIATLLTHICGGSAGKEGAALQIGGGLSAVVSKVFKLDDSSRKTLILCALSALFSAVFGTPLAAAVFVLEAARAKKERLWEFLPCGISSFCAFSVAQILNVHAERFSISRVDGVSVGLVLKALVISIAAALLAEAFCFSLRYVSRFSKKVLKNDYLRLIAGGCLVVIITLCIGNFQYNGSSIDGLHRIFDSGEVAYEAFALKLILTVATVSFGFKGGQIIPSIFIGAALGGAMAMCFGVSVELGAAVGLAAFFCGVTNCPIASILLCLEVFSGKAVGLLTLAVIISRLVSGKINLYGDTPPIFRRKLENA